MLKNPKKPYFGEFHQNALFWGIWENSLFWGILGKGVFWGILVKCSFLGKYPILVKWSFWWNWLFFIIE